MIKLPRKFSYLSQSVIIETSVDELPLRVHTLSRGEVHCVWVNETRWVNVLLSRDQAIELRNALQRLGSNEAE